jgi:hypothetical protein
VKLAGDAPQRTDGELGSSEAFVMQLSRAPPAYATCSATARGGCGLLRLGIALTGAPKHVNKIQALRGSAERPVTSKIGSASVMADSAAGSGLGLSLGEPSPAGSPSRATPAVP